MIEHGIFYQRLPVCQACSWWRGACTKGHALASPQGCPIQKFPPVEGAGYAADMEVSTEPQALTKGCCGADAEMPPLSWAQVLVHFAKSMATWIGQGLPLVDSATHAARYDQCKPCPHFSGFYCKRCKCVAYLKTKLATELCPDDPPRWV